ncbi:MAG: D-sedoheptulose 7-phosphate isomerase [Bacteroidales bacterium]|jgi:D-sedoheptulose 7-phosphate isomerase|nr:D-sedoheptulose 7-phosphate isomerase [Bacteroidales bacterium]
MQYLKDIRENFVEAQKVLDEFTASESNFEKIHAAAEVMVSALQKENKILSCGNGGSMSDAMHFAEELTGRYRDDRKALAAIAISDPGHISCVSNDFGYEFIFSRYLEAHGKPGDVLLAISTSGNSQNIINAIYTAKKRGVFVVGLTGKDGGKMADLCDIEIRAPKSQYADRVQEIHIKVIHTIIGLLEKMLEV